MPGGISANTKTFTLRADTRTQRAIRCTGTKYFEIEIVVWGSGKQNLNGEIYDLKRGSVYFLTNPDFHEIIISEPLLNDNISMDMLSVSPEFMKKSLSSTQRVFAPPPDEFQKALLARRIARRRIIKI